MLIISGSGGARCLSWCLVRLLRHCCTQDLKSRSASFGVLLTLPFSVAFSEPLVFWMTSAVFALPHFPAFHLEWLTCTVMSSTHAQCQRWSGLCSPVKALNATLKQCRCQLCGGTASSWHSMMSLIMSDLQVRLHRLRLQLPIVGGSGGRGSPGFHLLLVCQLCFTPELHRIAHDACCLWLLNDCNFPLGIVERRDSRLSPLVALAMQVCDRELLHSGCLLYVLWLNILYLRCRLDVFHKGLRCLDPHQSFLNSCNSLS